MAPPSPTRLHLHLLQLRIELGKTGSVGEIGISRCVGSLRRMVALVIVVFACKDRIEQVSLDIVIRPFILVDHPPQFLTPVLLLIDAGLMCREKQDGIAIERRYGEGKTTAVGGLHIDSCHLITQHQLTIQHHLVAQSAVVISKEWIKGTLRVVGLLYCAHFFHLNGAFCTCHLSFHLLLYQTPQSHRVGSLLI